jgi:fumarylacetoacetase
MLDGTHDPALTSWVVSANAAGTDFPLQNLPFGRLRPRGAAGGWRIGVAIGDEVLDLRAVREQEVWGGKVDRWLQPLSGGDLEAFMAMGSAARVGLRRLLHEGLCDGSPLRADLQPCLLPLADVELGLPCRSGDLVEFEAQPDAAGRPVGHAGRVASLGVSGQRVFRPRGPGTAGPSQQLDWTLQVAAFVGRGNVPGRPMSLAQAADDWFGLALLNGWCARDLPGRLLARGFASTLSPWVVTQEALAPFRREGGGMDLQLQVLLQRTASRGARQGPQVLAECGLRDATFTLAQLLVHLSSNGACLRPGDLVACEVTAASEGGSPSRRWLQDSDTVLLRARAERPGARGLGFGPCAGTVLPAVA